LPPTDPLAVFKGKVKELAEGINGKNWKQIQADLLAIAS